MSWECSKGEEEELADCSASCATVAACHVSLTVTRSAWIFSSTSVEAYEAVVSFV